MNNDRRQSIEEQMVEQYYGMKAHILAVEHYLSMYGRNNPDFEGSAWSEDEIVRDSPSRFVRSLA